MAATIVGKYRCLKCSGGGFSISSTKWTCLNCGQDYPCILGIPKLYIEEAVGAHDRKLRDRFYDGVFGSWYGFLMPFILLPVRPASTSRRQWAIYGMICALIATLLLLFIYFLTSPGNIGWTTILALPLLAIGVFFARQKYLLHLFLFAIPASLSIRRRRFKPAESFAAVHERVVTPLIGTANRLQVLDVSTGSCDSLYKHGWMKLNADYTAIDLSQTMLSKGLEMMSRNGVAIDLVLGNAMNLPFQSGTFDVVLNYGAINGMTDPGKALAEMVRVARPGALLLFLDEQMYPNASLIERAYFMKVLASHDVIHHCPVELLPPEVMDVHVAQVYEFYYICTARKRHRT